MRSTLPGKAVLVGALVFLGGAGPCGDDPTGLPGSDAIIVAFDQDLDRWPRDDWDFQDAALDDDGLRITIGYGGGCQTHTFWLLAVDGFRTLHDAGPTPAVAVPILLAHESRDDPCEAYITRTETFDLDPLRDAFREQVTGGPGRILLRIPRGQGSADTATIDLVLP